MYVFSLDPGSGKVSHVNCISNSFKEKGADARTWATKVSEVLGGKVEHFFYCLLSNILHVVSRQGEKMTVRKGQEFMQIAWEKPLRLRRITYLLSKSIIQIYRI